MIAFEIFYVSQKLYTAWVYFYHFGLPMTSQMELQLAAFEQATYPLYIVQGAEDAGQVIYQL
jgi:hypothetical protein